MTSVRISFESFSGVCYGKFDFEFKSDGIVALCTKRRAVAASISPLINYLAG